MSDGPIARLKTSLPVRLAFKTLTGALTGMGVGIATYEGNNKFDLFFRREQLHFMIAGALGVLFVELAELAKQRKEQTKRDLFRL
jgi:hypothetical protein